MGFSCYKQVDSKDRKFNKENQHRENKCGGIKEELSPVEITKGRQTNRRKGEK